VYNRKKGLILLRCKSVNKLLTLYICTFFQPSPFFIFIFYLFMVDNSVVMMGTDGGGRRCIVSSLQLFYISWC
jgi:hypothetical protein